LRKSSGVQINQTINSPSITVPIDRREGISSIPRRFMQRNESGKMIRHRRDVSRNQHAIILRCDLQNFWIGSAVCDHAHSIAKIDRGFPPPQSSPNLRVQVGIGLETDAQGCFSSLSRFACSKRSIMSGVRGCWALNSS
jgi:hypothetical protein